MPTHSLTVLHYPGFDARFAPDQWVAWLRQGCIIDYGRIASLSPAPENPDDRTRVLTVGTESECSIRPFDMLVATATAVTDDTLHAIDASLGIAHVLTASRTDAQG